MLGATVTKFVDHTKRVRDAADKAARRAFAKAAYRIFRDAQASIERSKEPSAPGTPPHTRRGQLKRAIRYDADKDGAVIGPLASMVGEAGAAHEFGGESRGGTFPERAYMAPALERELDQFAGEFSGSITR
jgi:phage gpG-like protein